MGYPSPHTQGYASVLYRLLIQERRHGGVPEVAGRVGIPPATLYEYARGKRVLPPDLIPSLYLATRDREFLAHLLDEAGIVFIELPEGTPERRDLLIEALRAQEEVTDVLEALRLALADDGRIDRHELRAIVREHGEAQAALLGLLCAVRAAHRAGHAWAGR